MRFGDTAGVVDRSPATGAEKPGHSARILSRVIETSSRLQTPAIRTYVRRLRDRSPGADPAEIVGRMEKHYLAAVTASGAAIGSAALVPGVGTLLALTLVASETALFLELTAVYILAVAEVHGVEPHDREQRRMLVLAALAGDDGRHAVARLLGPGRTNGAWLTEGAAAAPLSTLSAVNSRLMKYFVKKYALKRGALAFGKVLPVGIGAVVGAVGNRILGKKIVQNARSAFGPPPARWEGDLHLLPVALPDDPPAASGAGNRTRNDTGNGG